MNSNGPTIHRIEMKFQLNALLSAQVKDWARDHLGIDENCNAEDGDSYDVQTLYLDTAELDLFRRTDVIGAAKHRIRRYGNEQTLWVETKRKKKMVVRKNRTALFESDLMSRLATYPTDRVASDQREADSIQPNPQASADPWCGDWFLERVDRRRLQPAIQIGYRRFARTSTLNGANLRLTIDSHMSASPINDWSVSALPFRGFTSIADCHILELKFHNQMPHLFKELLRTFPIPATGFSKYRTAMQHRMTTSSTGNIVPGEHQVTPTRSYEWGQTAHA